MCLKCINPISDLIPIKALDASTHQILSTKNFKTYKKYKKPTNSDITFITINSFAPLARAKETV